MALTPTTVPAMVSERKFRVQGIYCSQQMPHEEGRLKVVEGPSPVKVCVSVDSRWAILSVALPTSLFPFYWEAKSHREPLPAESPPSCAHLSCPHHPLSSSLTLSCSSRIALSQLFRRPLSDLQLSGGAPPPPHPLLLLSLLPAGSQPPRPLFFFLNCAGVTPRASPVLSQPHH